jgi:hypothetical protein
VSCSEKQHDASLADEGGTPNNDISENNEGSDIPARRDQPTFMGEAAVRQEPNDSDMAAPFLGADGGGNEDVEMQQEPTLAHCVEAEEIIRPARTSAIANIRVQLNGKQQQIKEEVNASTTVADVQRRLASQLKVEPDKVQLMASGKALSGSLSLFEYPRDSEGCIAIDAIAPVKSQTPTVLEKGTSESAGLQAPAGRLPQARTASGKTEMEGGVRLG